MNRLLFVCVLSGGFALLALPEKAEAWDGSCYRGYAVGIYSAPVDVYVARPYFAYRPYYTYSVARPVYGYRTFYRPYYSYYYPRYSYSVGYGYRGYRW